MPIISREVTLKEYRNSFSSGLEKALHAFLVNICSEVISKSLARGGFSLAEVLNIDDQFFFLQSFFDALVDAFKKVISISFEIAFLHINYKKSFP